MGIKLLVCRCGRVTTEPMVRLVGSCGACPYQGVDVLWDEAVAHAQRMLEIIGPMDKPVYILGLKREPMGRINRLGGHYETQ